MGYMRNINEPTVKFHTEVITVGTTKVQLTDHKEASWVQLMHQHATATVYYGGDDVSTANGWGALKNADTSERYPVQNTSKLWAISDTAGVSLKILWGE